jgi:hypothetical protein
MQQEAALGLLQAFMLANGLEAPQDEPPEVALEERPPLLPGDDWDPELQFRFFPDSGELKWYALIYEFPEPPSERLLEACREEQRSGTADMGGGTLESDPEHKSLHLVRTYRQAVPVEQLSADVMALQLASQT